MSSSARNLRSRAATLIQASIHSLSGRSVGSGRTTAAESDLPTDKKPADGPAGRDSHSSNEKTLASSGEDAASHNREANRIVRTIPTWVHTMDEIDEEINPASQLLPKRLSNVQVAQHNNSPSTKPNQIASSPRLQRPGHDRILSHHSPRLYEPVSRWRAFTDASAYPSLPNEGGELVNEDWLLEHGPDYSRPWLADLDDDHTQENGRSFFRNKAKRRVWYLQAQHTLMRSPIIPLIIRTINWTFSFIALILGVEIYLKLGSKTLPTSAGMAIIVDAVALVYLVCITYDEYTGKPLGLRPAAAKLRLIFLDLIFIVFDSANLSIAFENLSGDSSACRDNSADLTSKQKKDAICHEQAGLAAVLLIALVAWLLTFAISVLRLIQRMVD